MMDKDLLPMNLNECQAAKFLGLENRQTLSNWRHERRGPAYCKVGRRIIYRREDLESYMTARRIDPEALTSLKG